MSCSGQSAIPADAFDYVQGQLGDRTKLEVVFPYLVRRFRSQGIWDVLDVGCGNGAFCRYGALHGLKLDGVDISARLLERAKQRDRAECAQRNYYCLDAGYLTADMLHRFDGISCIFSVQDMAAPARFLAAAANARTNTIILIVCESYFHLTNPRVPHSIARIREKCTGFDHATHISRADWGDGSIGITYCRSEKTYCGLVSAAGLKITALDYFGKTRNYLRFVNLFVPSTRPFFCLCCRAA
jgi:SAM-dependent methyltransferase